MPWQRPQAGISASLTPTPEPCQSIILLSQHIRPILDAQLALLITPEQNGLRFANDIFRCIFLNEKFWILTKISLRFVPKGPIDYNPALIKIMAWRQIGDKPLSELMLTRFTDAYMRHWAEMRPGQNRRHLRKIFKHINF